MHELLMDVYQDTGKVILSKTYELCNPLNTMLGNFSVMINRVMINKVDALYVSRNL